MEASMEKAAKLDVPEKSNYIISVESIMNGYIH